MAAYSNSKDIRFRERIHCTISVPDSSLGCLVHEGKLGLFVPPWGNSHAHDEIKKVQLRLEPFTMHLASFLVNEGL